MSRRWPVMVTTPGALRDGNNTILLWINLRTRKNDKSRQRIVLQFNSRGLMLPSGGGGPAINYYYLDDGAVRRSFHSSRVRPSFDGRTKKTNDRQTNFNSRQERDE